MRTQVITLRTTTNADVSAVDRLLQSSYTRLLKSCYSPSVQVTAVPIISRANPALMSSGTYYVAVDREGTIVGAGGWTRSVKGRDVADVRHVATDYRHLRQGIARRIMMGVIAEARLAGIRRLDCLSTPVAVPFYQAMGFTPQCNVTIGLRPGIDLPVVRMVRDL